ncbi:putative acetyltransferase, GNAT family [Sclerotinia borealis F-4128]|uniref:Putative acetyltransferase, GNAT family n=1 Tax=Sclerotinia borealis (strain F-4128) TaxID=1432307 RepID=W9C9I7_SCLBF|nr:putative acetyltransferase, GNAT family [Sclerotinia borealis F-4128]
MATPTPPSPTTLIPNPASLHAPELIVFKDSCHIREQVYVHEQQAVPLVHHLDNDDARSVHFVIYAPIITPVASTITNTQQEHIPVGTIRLLPYPDHIRPLPNSRIITALPDAEISPPSHLFFQSHPPYQIDKASTLYDGIEPYIRLGRLAVLPEYRGQGYADSLIQVAMKWAAEHPKFSYEMLSEEEKKEVPEWRG